MYCQPFDIPAHELDPDYKHLHHARILDYLEKGRVGYMSAIGQPQDELVKSGVFIVIRSVQVRYRREVFGGRIEVSCEEVNSRGKLILMKQRLFGPDGDVKVIAHFELVCIGGEPKRAIEPPSYLREAFHKGGKST